MKKVVLSAIAVFVFGITNAQDTKFGIKGGVNFANQKFEASGSSMTANSIVGVQIGGLIEAKINDKFAIQPELLFSTEGSKLKADGEEFLFNLSYINVPVMAKFYASPKFSIQAGPQLGFLVSAKGKYNGVKDDVKEMFKSINFGLNLGAGYEFTEKCLVDVRYNFGLTDVAEDNNGEGLKVKGSVFSIAVGYKF
ncbi:porin family protein [Flavobacterium daejeonense]|uniref:porin family protein n=1 Tax=Flavobacterium daejeonense TaxID=350893 RepID=UPI00047AF0F8|nr:porin family protein [Flavobacterium daejeonense]